MSYLGYYSTNINIIVEPSHAAVPFMILKTQVWIYVWIVWKKGYRDGMYARGVFSIIPTHEKGW